MSWLAALALPLALWATGRKWMGRCSDRAAVVFLDRAPVALVAGALAFYLALCLLQLAGIPWTRWTLLAVLALLLVLPRRSGAREERGRSALSLGWGDAAALAAVVAFALVALTLWATTPDFVYHWGLKAERFALARAIDFRFLARPWNGGPGIHPDYPNLLPSLYAATALLGERFDAQALMLWSAVWLAALLVALRAALAASGVERWTAQAALAATALATAAYGLGNLLAGGADWMIALALAVAAPALCGTGGEKADLQIGVAAAFAAASKIEGVPLAAVLVAVHLVRRILRDRRPASGESSPIGRAPHHAQVIRPPRAYVPALLATALPPLLAIVPWIAEATRHGLWQANAGAFDWSRRAEIWRGWREVAASAPLHGLPWALALLPLVWLSRRTRALAAVLTAQALVYLWAYLASPIDPWLYVLSNGSRLAFQLLPATLVGAVIATEPHRRAAAPP